MQQKSFGTLNLFMYVINVLCSNILFYFHNNLFSFVMQTRAKHLHRTRSPPCEMTVLKMFHRLLHAQQMVGLSYRFIILVILSVLVKFILYYKTTTNNTQMSLIKLFCFVEAINRWNVYCTATRKRKSALGDDAVRVDITTDDTCTDVRLYIQQHADELRDVISQALEQQL